MKILEVECKLNRKKIRNFMIKHQQISRWITNLYNHIPLNNSFHIRSGNYLECHGILKRTKICVKGKGNRIIIGKLSRLVNSSIEIKGNNNTIIVGDRGLVTEGEFFIEDDLGKIEIGKDTNICGHTHLACIEGCSITIGEDCLFSSAIVIRTGDSHSVIDSKTKQRINPSKNVRIGNHVWIGNQVIILKGVNISNHTIIGAGSLVTKPYTQGNIIIAGNPAKIVKSSIEWLGERI